MKRSICLFALLVNIAAAETLSGTVVDIMCRGKDLAGHTRECAVACSRSGYGLVTADGKFLKFDEAGNARTLTALKKLTREKDLKAKVTGSIAGEILKVDTIDLQQ